jgi:hypothetical protein
VRLGVQVGLVATGKTMSSGTANRPAPVHQDHHWQKVRAAQAWKVLLLVELRGFEPLTSCMPLTSHPLALQRAALCFLVSVLLSTRMALRRQGAACGVVRHCCWQIAGSYGATLMC